MKITPSAKKSHDLYKVVRIICTTSYYFVGKLVIKSEFKLDFDQNLNSESIVEFRS